MQNERTELGVEVKMDVREDEASAGNLVVEPAVPWRNRLSDSTGWRPAGLDWAGPMPLGCVAIKMTMLCFSVPSVAAGTRWPVEAMWVAPLADFESIVWGAWAQTILAERLLSSEAIDLEAIRTRRLALEASSRSKGLVDVQGADGLCAPLMVGALTRNAADFSSARPGELVSLDGLRGSSAMLLAKCTSRELSESEFASAWSGACNAAETLLGQNARGWRGSAWVKGPPGMGEHPLMERPWPSSLGEWESMWRASAEAAAIDCSIGAGSPRGRASRKGL